VNADWKDAIREQPPDSRVVGVCLCWTVVTTGHYNHGKKLWRPGHQLRGTLEGVTHWDYLPAPAERLPETRR
jgi:hypothetical protein